MLRFHRPWFQKIVFDMGYTLIADSNKSAPTLLLPCLSPDKAQASTTVYTVIGTAKANGLKPEKCFSHLLTVLPERFAHDPKAQIDDLLPWDHGLHDLCHV